MSPFDSFPTLIWLGRLDGSAIAAGLMMQAGWTLFFVLLARVAYRRGLRRYTAFGG
jgi:ABC-2 type transport system permease protein